MVTKKVLERALEIAKEKIWELEDLKGEIHTLWFESLKLFREWEKENPSHKGRTDDKIFIKTSSVITGVSGCISGTNAMKTLAEIKEVENERDSIWNL